MKLNLKYFFLITVFLVLMSCQRSSNEKYFNYDHIIKRTNENYNKIIQKENDLKDSVDKWVDINCDSSIDKLDKLMETSLYMNCDKVDFLLYSGELLCQKKEYNLALNQIRKAKKIGSSPNILCYEAKCLLKVDLPDTALARKCILEAISVNSDYYFVLGNYFEIINDRDNAVINYEILCNKESQVYKRACQRIIDLQIGGEFLDDIDMTYYKPMRRELGDFIE